MTLLGIDIGGTKTVLAVANSQGETLLTRRFPTPLSGDWQRDLEALIESARSLLGEAGGSGEGGLERIGVSVPGPTDPFRGVLLNPPNLPGWRDVPVAERLSRAFGAETRVENDANAAVLAESRFGAGQGVSDLVLLTMSTGVGGGVISGGRLVRGAFGGAGEPGHMPIEDGGRRCACGLDGCLEAYVGGQAWRDRLRETLSATGRVVALAGGERQAVEPRHVVAAAREGDAEACAAFDEWLAHLVRGIVPIVMLLEPQRILLGTIAVAAGEALCFNPLRARLRERLWPLQGDRLELRPIALTETLPERAGLAVALMGGGGEAVG